MWHPVRLSAAGERGATFPPLEDAAKGIAPGLVEDAREHVTGSWGGCGILHRQHHIDLVAFVRVGIVIYGQLVAARRPPS
jgi:hypothetical protein